MILSLLSRTLTEAGYLIKTAESGEQALEIASTCEFDFMITDCSMRGMSGPELAEAFLKIQPRTLVIFITGHLSPDIATALEHKEVLGWLQKPFTPDELQEMLNRGREEC